MNYQTDLFKELGEIFKLGTEEKFNGTFYNTIQASEQELKEFKADAKSHQKIIMQVFESGEKLTALEVKRRTGINHDSCKRSINTLFKKKLILKLGKEDMVMEEFGKKNHRWVKR